jgi:hypothetical protein
LSTKQGLLWKPLIELLGDILIGFQTQLLNQLASRRGVEYVGLDRHILVIKLIEQSEGRNVLVAIPVTGLANLLNNILRVISKQR